MAALSKAWVSGRSLAGIAGSNRAAEGEHEYMSFVRVTCYQVSVLCYGIAQRQLTLMC